MVLGINSIVFKLFHQQVSVRGNFLTRRSCFVLIIRMKEKRQETESRSKHNFICVQTSYMFRLYIAIIRLNIEPQKEL
jgi:hypothetical protein